MRMHVLDQKEYYCKKVLQCFKAITRIIWFHCNGLDYILGVPIKYVLSFTV